MKKYGHFLIISLLLPCAAKAQSAMPLTEGNLQQSVFQVRVEKTIPIEKKAPGFRGDEDMEHHYQSLMAVAHQQGTGFCVSHQGRPLVVTNYHVVWLADTNEPESIKAVTYTGRTFGLKLEDYDPFYDLAILSFHPSNVPIPKPLVLAPEISGTTISVFAAGFPKGEWAVATGNFEGWAVHPATGRPDMLGHSVAINYGYSGAPLLVAGGDVIGVNVIKASGGKDLNLALPSTNIQRLLQTLGQPHRRCYLGVELRESTDGLVYLKEIMRNSPAVLKGHRYRGWELAAINGEEVNNLSQALRLLEAIAPGGDISLLLRNPATRQAETVNLQSSTLEPNHLEELGRYVLGSIGYQDENFPWEPNIRKFKPDTRLSNGSAMFGNAPLLIKWVGADAGLRCEEAWATPTLYDLGVAVRLSAFDGEIGLWLQAAKEPDGMPYQATFQFTGANGLREKTLFY